MATKQSYEETFESVETSCTEVKRIIGWLEYVHENELTPTERFQIIEVCQAFARVVQPIASKYLD